MSLLDHAFEGTGCLPLGSSLFSLADLWTPWQVLEQYFSPQDGSCVLSMAEPQDRRNVGL